MNIAVLKERLENLDNLFSSTDMTEAQASKALVLDLSDESFYDWEIPAKFMQCYVSGPALGARLWAEFAGSDVEDDSTYESNNPVVITASSFSNSGMPGCESVSIAFRSPVTGALRFNVLPLTVGMRLKNLGYVALILTGRLRRPTIIEIKRSGVVYNVSEVFIDYTVSQVESLIGSNPMTTSMTIGPAGEQKIPYAAVVCEGGTTGRGGLGRVFGYKNIKSLFITGFDTEFERAGVIDGNKAVKALTKAIEESPYCKAMRRSGSACRVKSSGRKGWAPVFNFSRRTDPRLFHLGGDEISRRYGQNCSGCISCPVLCRHRTGDGVLIPGYESILMLGSNIACFDMDKIIERHAQCLDMGLDPVSTGNVMGWANEAWTKGLANLFEPGFSFKDNSKVLPLIEMIARKVGTGEPLGFGSYALGQACGDSSFSFTIRNLECGPYDYRGAYAQSISDAMGFWFSNPFEIDSDVCTKEHADWAVLCERLVMGLESYGISRDMIVPTMVDTDKGFRRLATIIPKSAIKRAKPTILADAMSAYRGFDISGDNILELGDRCWRLIYEINRALGFDMLNDTENLMPEHFCIDPDSNHNDDSIVPFRSLMDRYCFLRKQTIALQGSGFGNN